MANENDALDSTPAPSIKDAFPNDSASEMTLINDPDSHPSYTPESIPTQSPDSSGSTTNEAEYVLSSIRYTICYIYSAVYRESRNIYTHQTDKHWLLNNPISDEDLAEKTKQYSQDAANSVAYVIRNLHIVLQSLHSDESLLETAHMVVDAILEVYTFMERKSKRDDMDRIENDNEAPVPTKTKTTTETRLVLDAKENEKEKLSRGYRVFDCSYLLNVVMRKTHSRLVERVRSTGGEQKEQKEQKEQRERFIAQAAVLATANVRNAIMSAMQALTKTSGEFHTTIVLETWTRLQRTLLRRYVQSAAEIPDNILDDMDPAGRSISRLYLNYADMYAKEVEDLVKSMRDEIKRREEKKRREEANDCGTQSQDTEQPLETRKVPWYRRLKNIKFLRDAKRDSQEK